MYKQKNGNYFSRRVQNFLLSAVLFFASLSFFYAQENDADYRKLLEIDYYQDDMTEAYRLLAVLEKKYPENGYILAEKGAWQMFGENDLNLALITLSKAAKLLPENDNILTLRSTAFYRKGLLQKAVEDQKAAIAINPKPIQFYIKLGGYYYEMKDYQTALDTFLQGVEKNPSQAEIYGEAFAAYAMLSDTNGASRLFDKGLREKNIDAGFLRCYYGNFFMRLKMYREASEQYQIAYNVPEPHMYGEDYNNAAISFMKIGQLDKAMSFINLAVKKEPKVADYLNNKADIAMTMKDYETVIDAASKAIAVDEKNALAHMYMAIGYKWGRNDQQKADYYESKAKSLDSEKKITDDEKFINYQFPSGISYHTIADTDQCEPRPLEIKKRNVHTVVRNGSKSHTVCCLYSNF